MKSFATFVAFALAMQVQRLPPLTTSQQQVDSVGEPFAVLEAEKAWLGADAFWPLARAGDSLTRRYAIRAIGRLEDPANVPGLLALGRARGELTTPIAAAIVQSLYGSDPARDPGLIASVSTWFLEIADPDLPGSMPVISRPLGEIRYGTEDQFRAAERRLVRIQDKFESFPKENVRFLWYQEAQSALETLYRFNPRIGPPSDAAVARLRTAVRGTHAADNPLVAFRALTGRGLDADTELFVLGIGSSGELSRLATQVLAGSGGGLDDDQRAAAILDKLKASDPQVRYEALRAYVRRGLQTGGCQPIVDLLDDLDSHVVLAAIDALGDACKSDEELTRRLAGEIKVPPSIGPWHRETHAFVTVAKRSPERVALLMNGFTTHVSFWVRMYSVQAAVAANDVAQLERLARDADDNVREAALAPLLALKKEKTDPALIDAFDRADVQLLRSAAMLAKAAAPEDKLRTGLTNALLRLTTEGKETSRDGRLALIDALEVHGRPENVQKLKPLAGDPDPLVAAAAAKLLSKLSGSPVEAAPAPVRRGWLRQFTDLSQQCVSVALSSARSFRMRMSPAGAPIAADRFLKLALVDHYYDGLTIHRVVPNFVIQAGSPNANEYSGFKEYMRDEIGLPNVAGSVGLSIRGRNTGDAQFYVNLVDNPRLDHGYTIFARVLPEDMGVVQSIEEGVVMTKITPTECPGVRHVVR